MTTVQILADSICHTRITTFLVHCPRFLLAEINTHRMIAKNAASSRAIPVEKRIVQVRKSGYAPYWWGENQPGMQAEKSMAGQSLEDAKRTWAEAIQDATGAAAALASNGVHKQFANRLIETFAYVDVVLTATEWANFFSLRVSDMAQPEFDWLAGHMLKAYVASSPQPIRHGEWHIPFGGRWPCGTDLESRLLAASARCARTSYETHGGEFSIEADLALAQRLLSSGHMSPFSHCARAMDYSPSVIEDATLSRVDGCHFDGVDLWSESFRWWHPLRKTLAGENRATMDADQLLRDFDARWASRKAVIL
jgi:hypothetical protein